MRQRAQLVEQQRLEDLKVAQYLKDKAEREAKAEEEVKKAKAEKEREHGRLLAMQVGQMPSGRADDTCVETVREATTRARACVCVCVQPVRKPTTRVQPVREPTTSVS